MNNLDFFFSERGKAKTIPVIVTVTVKVKVTAKVSVRVTVTVTVTVTVKFTVTVTVTVTVRDNITTQMSLFQSLSSLPHPSSSRPVLTGMSLSAPSHSAQRSR